MLLWEVLPPCYLLTKRKRKLQLLYTCLLLNHFVCKESYELLFPFFDPVVHLPPECLVWFPDHPPVQQGSAWTVLQKTKQINKAWRKDTKEIINTAEVWDNLLFFWTCCRFSLPILFCAFSLTVFHQEFLLSRSPFRPPSAFTLSTCSHIHMHYISIHFIDMK